MKALISIRLFVSFLILTPLAVSMQKEDPLISESYALSQRLADNEQLFYLDELNRVSTMAVSVPAKAEEWCITEFRVASAQADQRNRIAGQKNALQYLAALNPARAVQLLPEVNLWRHNPGQLLPEDLRSDAALTIFVDFLKSNPRGLATVAAQARYLGDTGQYPYRAMAAVIAPRGHGQSRPSSGETNDIVGDALSFYEHEKGFSNRDEEFLVLVKALPGSAIDKDLAAKVTSTFVRRLTLDPIRSSANYYGEVHTAAGNVIPFRNRNQAFLFQAFPAVRQFRPELADRLRQQHAELDQATDDMLYISGGFVMGNPTSEEATGRHLRNIQESLFYRIREQQDCNPSSAAIQAQRLTNTSSRIVAFASTVPAVARSNPGEARSIYWKQRLEFRGVSDLPDKLDAAVALAQAAPSVGDLSGYKWLSSAAFEMGAKLFASSTADRRAQIRPGFEQLYELVSFTASHPTDSLKAKVQRLPDGWLKAYLLLYEAEGHAKQQRTRPEPGPCPD